MIASKQWLTALSLCCNTCKNTVLYLKEWKEPETGIYCPTCKRGLKPEETFHSDAWLKEGNDNDY